MMRSLFSGVSGLKNHQTRMDVIGNNISNVNTTGFKSSRVTFTDTLNQTINAATAATNTLGGTNPKQVGLGSAVGSVDLLFNDGSVQSTGKNTDLCLTGNALFVVKEGQQTYYTRDGAFEFDGEGNYVLPGSGLKVQGWNGTDGVLDTSAAPTDVNVQAGKSMEASATVLATYANNLNAAALTIESIAGGAPATITEASATNPVTISDGTNTYQVTNGKFYSVENYTFANDVNPGDSTITLVDSYGRTQTLNLTANATTSTSANVKASTTGGTVLSGTVLTTASSANPVTLSDGTYSYKVTSGSFYNTDSYTISAVNAGDSSITVTDTAGNAQTLALSPGATVDAIAATANVPTGGTIVSTTTTVTPSSTNPVAISDGTNTYIVDGGGSLSNTTSYTIGPVATTDTFITVTDSAGNSQNLTLVAPPTSNVTTSVPVSSYDGCIVASTANPVTISDGTNTYIVTNGTFYDGETITISPVNQSATTISVTGTISGSQSLTLSTPAAATVSTAVPATSITGGISNTTVEVITEASVGSPVTITDGTHSYKVTNGTFSSLETYNIDAVTAGDTTITVTDSASNKQTLNLAAGATASAAATTISSQSGGTQSYTAAVASKESPVTLTMSDGSKVTQTSGTYEVGHSLPITTTLSIYDTLGNVHSLPVYFTKSTVSSAVGNSWTVSLTTDGRGITTLIEPDGSTTTVTLEDTTVDFTTSGKYDTSAGRNAGGRTTTLTLTNGALGTQTVTLELSSLTQYAGNNTVNGTTDGYAAGTLESISIDTTGTIYGTYTNGVKQAEAQVAVAQFTNASGLTKTGSSLYQASSNSGTPNVKTTTDLGVKITPSALEMSNVDIANEFADMIVTQRGFQSNSKIITVGDEMLETVINMKR